MGVERVLNLISASYKRNETYMTVYTKNTKIRPILDCLLAEGAISNYSYFKRGSSDCLTIKLKYYKNRPAVPKIKAKKKVYRDYTDSSYKLIKKDHLGLNLKVVTTTQGIMTNTQAKAKGLGGRIICTLF